MTISIRNIMRRPKTKLGLSSNRGAALLTVLVAIMIITLMTLELQYNAMVERKLAYNDLNQLQSYYLAKSGARLGLLRLDLYLRAKKKKIPGSEPFLDSIWNTPLPAFPPVKTAIDKLNKADKDAAEKQLEETKISTGQFSTVITSEASKINLNFLVIPKGNVSTEYNAIDCNATNPPDNLVAHVGKLLCNVIQDIFKKSDNPVDEFGNIRPDEVVNDIMDWVNPNSVRISGNNKDSFYEQQKPPYRAKRGRFFTLEELKLVKSINDALYQKLKPHVTVYALEGEININEAANDILKAIYPFTEDDLKKLAEEKAKNGNWASTQKFVEFITNTLGRSDFKRLYPDEAKYPFTVKTQSFIIDSLGVVTKNKVQIQRKIRVAVALSSGGGNQVKQGITNKADCEKDPNFFFSEPTQSCRSLPKNEKECGTLAGEWIKNGNDFQCRINNPNIVLLPIPKTNTAEPNAIKVLYWMET